LNNNFQRRGILFVLSAPSGAGKTTLCSALRHKPDFVYAVSCTTRAPRPGEVEGEDYHFLSEKQFDHRLAAGEFLEYAEVHGSRYGTLKNSVTENLRKGIDLVIDIDSKGAELTFAPAGTRLFSTPSSTSSSCLPTWRN
jgi:guanylate kinase